MTKAYIEKAENTLRRLDPILGNLIGQQKLVVDNRPEDYFAALCRSIIGQQVSVAAANAIYTRFEAMTELKPSTVLGLTEETIKQIGLSKQKTAYVQDLAKHFDRDPDVYQHLETQTDEQVIAELTDVKGIGDWTAQMFLMFTLQRPDVFAPKDIGLQRAMMQLYKWESIPPIKELETFAERWKPYRTVASLHLWQSVD